MKHKHAPPTGRGRELAAYRNRARSWGKTRKAVRGKDRSKAIKESRES